MIDLVQCRRQVNRLAEQHRQAAEQVQKESGTLDALGIKIGDIEESSRILQGIAQALQQQSHERISRVVTKCLNAVFSEPYEFQVRFDRKRGKTEARLVFLRDEMILDDPINEVGGGVIDIVALALRLSAVLLSRLPCRRMLVLDEPLKNVRGRENKQQVRRMLLALAEELGVQFLMNVDVDAYPEFALGTLVEMGCKN